MSDLFSLLPFFIFLMGLFSLMSGVSTLFHLDKRVAKRRDKLLAKLRKKGKEEDVSLENLKKKERLGALYSVVLGLLLCALIVGRLNIAFLEPGVLTLEIGNESAAAEYEYETTIADFVSSKHIPGLVVGIVQGEDSFLYTYGYERLHQDRRVNQTTVFEIGSISKAFTGLMLADSMERGLITLQDTVLDIFGDSGFIQADSVFQDVTMQHLATHTSGLPRLPRSLGLLFGTTAAGLTGGNPYGGITAERMHEYLAGTKSLRGTGERWAYSNYGSGLLGMSVSMRRNQSYEDMLQESIADPLGMENTSVYYGQNATRYADGFSAYLSFGRMHIAVGSTPWVMAEGMVGAGGIRSTGADMLRFLEALVHDKLPFAASSTHLLFSVDDSWGMGTKWMIDKLDDNAAIIWHNGQTGGFNSYLGFHSHADVGVFALSNSHIDVQGLAESLLDHAYRKSR